MKTLAAALVCAAFVSAKKLPPKDPVPKVLPGEFDPDNSGVITKELPKDLPDISFEKPQEPQVLPTPPIAPKVLPTPEKTKPKTPDTVKPKPTPAADKTKPPRGRPDEKPSEPEPVPETPQYEIPTADQQYWDSISARNFYGRNLWTGVFSGLYGMSSGVERPTEDCFGPWIKDKMVEINFIKRKAKEEGLFAISMEEASKVAYDSVDLLFLNDKYCHFRHTLYDVRYYCSHEDSPCTVGNVMENMQKNTFGIITQVSTAAATFKQTPWEQMDQESRGFALNQLGHSFAQLFTDLTGFKATKNVDVML